MSNSTTPGARPPTGMPYNPIRKRDRAGNSKRDGGGKTHNKRPVWWERGSGGLTNGKVTTHEIVERLDAPKGKRIRRG